MSIGDGGYEPLRGDPEYAESSSSSRQVTRSTPHGGTFTYTPNSSDSNYTYTYTYGRKGLSGLFHNRYTLASAIFASTGGLLFGYDQGVIANVLVMRDFKARWSLTAWEVGSMTAILELGALIGALLAGVLADRYSRRHSIFLACVVFCIGSTFQCAAQTLQDIFIGRAVGGVGIGSLSMLSPLYLAEISPPEHRGSLMALEQFAIVLGVVMGFWSGFFTRDFSGSISWRAPLALQLIPGIMLAIGCLILPPSPRLLVMHGRYDEALTVLGRLRGRPINGIGVVGEQNVDILIEFLEMQVEERLISRSGAHKHHPGSSWIAKEWASWKRLFSPELLDRTLIGIFVMFFQQWTGINALLYYGPSLMHSIGLQGDTVELICSGGIGIAQFIASVPAIAWIDRLGRKPLLKGGGVVMGFSHLCIAALIWIYSSNWPEHPFAAWLALGFVYVFTLAYGMSFGPVAWVLPSEVFPMTARSKGVAVTTASNWINNFILGLVAPVFLSLSPTLTFLLFCTACFTASLWAHRFVPETANVPLEEVDGLFKSQVGREELLAKEQVVKDVGLDAVIKELASQEHDEHGL